MKIRIKGNSIRYRLTRTDVERFAADGYLEERTHFGDTTLIYALQSSEADEMIAVFNNNKITLFMSETMAGQWALTDKVGFENNRNGFYLLVEKDFKCLDNVTEDQSDNYPNPLLEKFDKQNI
jgi:hypothetical protein